MKSFREYLSKNILSEMAMPKDVSKQPILIDKDDIEFLEQFPPELWSSALQKRWDMFFGAVKERFDRRGPDYDKIKNQIKNALLTGDHSQLDGLSQETIDAISRSDKVIGNEKEASQAAKNLAYFEIEKIHPHIDEKFENKLHKFKLRLGGKTTTILAKPYLNRMAHKIERTKGKPHVPGSGLEGETGQYGYDLYQPIAGQGDIASTTRGLKFPMQGKKEIGKRLSAFLSQNAHQMYGDLPQDTKWDKSGNVKDVWTIEKKKKEIERDIRNKLVNAEDGELVLPDGTPVNPSKITKRNELEKYIRMMVNGELLGMAERGELKGPPNPKFPEGAPIKLKTTSTGKRLDIPHVYLPQKEVPIRYFDNGQIKIRKEQVPIVRPAEYLREIGSEEDDENFVQNNPSLLRGYNKDYIKVDGEAYKKKNGYLAAGALHPNQNTAGRSYLDSTDPDYDRLRQELFDAMGETYLNAKNEPVRGDKDNFDGPFFYDVIKGIWNCIKSACGGMTGHEVSIMKTQVKDIHNLVLAKMLMNLRDERLQSVSGRRQFAKDIASSWAQQDLGEGGGTRRKRALSHLGRNKSMDYTSKGKEGDDYSLRDAIEGEMDNKLRGSADAEDDTKLRQGGRKIDTGSFEFGYDLDNYRKVVQDLSQEADMSDKEKQNVSQMLKKGVSGDLVKMLEDGLGETSAIITKIKVLYKNMFKALGIKDDIAEIKADDKIRTITASTNSSKEIVSRFQNDADVQNFLNGNSNKDQGSISNENVEKFKDTIQQIGDRIKYSDTQNKIWDHIKNVYNNDPAVVQYFQKVLNSMKSSGNKPPQSGNEKLKQLIANKDWLNLAKEKFFLMKAPVDQLTAVLSKLQDPSIPDSTEKRVAQFMLKRAISGRK